MIVKKKWLQTRPFTSPEWEREGWFLFGLIPLYIRDVTSRGRFSAILPS